MHIYLVFYHVQFSYKSDKSKMLCYIACLNLLNTNVTLLWIVSDLIGNIVRGESPTSTIATLAETMPNPLDQVPDILIEPIGVFQYILINVTLEKDPDGNAPYKIIVRGKKYAKNHGKLLNCLNI